MKVAFLDRDGTLIWEPPDTKQVDRVEQLRFLAGVPEGLTALQQAGFALVLVSNQDGMGTPSFPSEAFQNTHDETMRRFAEHGIRFAEVFICPHLKQNNCACRKPKTGLVDAFLARNEIDRAASLMIGDRETDHEFARNIGVRFVAMQTNSTFPRLAFESRKTKETLITAFVNLDGSGHADIRTGIGFFDHMLELLARHALIDLELRAAGDLQVDEHHTVEDSALVLGCAMTKALGDKRGIERYGFLLPMDEALAEIALDLSGRPLLVFDGTFRRERVGEMPTELVPHFFSSLAQTLRCTLHMTLKSGENEHHKIEALFKGLGRCLRQAFRHSPHERDIPSTKGTL